MKPIKARNRFHRGQRITFTHALAFLKQRHEKSISNNRNHLGNRSALGIFFIWLQNRLG